MGVMGVSWCDFVAWTEEKKKKENISLQQIESFVCGQERTENLANNNVIKALSVKHNRRSAVHRGAVEGQPMARSTWICSSAICHFSFT